MKDKLFWFGGLLAIIGLGMMFWMASRPIEFFMVTPVIPGAWPLLAGFILFQFGYIITGATVQRSEGSP